MVPKLNKNAIINGFIHYYCLVCETYLRSEEAAELHMEKQDHKSNLEASSYMDKYNGDCLRKVKAGYFCEYCNVLLSTGAKVKLHIEEKIHENNKGIALLNFVENDLVAFHGVVMKQEAWHGFSGDTCAICNCDVEDFLEHIADHGHILKLVQRRIQFGPNKSLYRKVDESAFQCLTCNKILAMTIFEKHFYESKHQQLYDSCCNKKNKEHHQSSLKNEEKPLNGPSSTLTEDAFDEHTNNTNILDVISKFEKNYISINLESKNAFCKKCYVDVCFDCNEINRHIHEHRYKEFSPLSMPAEVEQNHKISDMKPKTKTINEEQNTDKKYLAYRPNDTEENIRKGQTTSQETPNDPHIKHSKKEELPTTMEDYARKNNILYIAGNTEAHCTICIVKLPANLRNMTEHVNGASHKRRKRFGSDLRKEQVNKFIKEWIRIERGEYDIVVINDEYCITAMSFMMIKKESSTLNCLYCKTTINERNVTEHIKSPNHGALSRISVVLRDDDEFVREIRSGVYHCGYCHVVVGDWSEFEEHMVSGEHKEMKKTMKNRLKAHKRAIQQHREEKQMREFLTTMRYYNMFNYRPWFF